MVCHAERETRTASRRLLIGLALCCLTSLLSAASAQDPAPAAAPTASPGQHPLDEPLNWINEARRNHGNIRDYTCTFVTRENLRGHLGDENVIAMKVRTQPFSVSMRWLAPSKIKNQEVCFVLGRNNNKIRVKATGLSKVAGFVSVDPKDPRVFEHSRHDIYEAGLGSLIEQTAQHWEAERRINKTQVNIADYTFERPCVRVETLRTERRPEFYCYRSVLYLDKDTKLPVRNENYDWPRPGGTEGGDLMETFSYVNLRYNVGLTDADFNR
jgi:hypothetical protein